MVQKTVTESTVPGIIPASDMDDLNSALPKRGIQNRSANIRLKFCKIADRPGMFD